MHGVAASACAASAAPSGSAPSQVDGLPKHLKCSRQLGKGAYGTVYLCEDTSLPGSPQVAVKHIKNAARHGKSILREVRLLARLCHENLLHLLDFTAVPSPNFDDVFLVLPYMASDLHKVIQSRQPLTDKHVQVILVQIVRALGYLHGAGVAHRDLKPANILLAADCKLKVCDFGLARGDMQNPSEVSEDQACGVLTEYVVTRWYRAPEVMLLPKQYTSAVDLWSVGCILCEILGRRAVFPGKNHIDMVCRVAEVLGTPPEEEVTWLPRDSDAYRFLRKVCPQSLGVPLESLYPRATPLCLDLARGLLRWDPVHRLTAAEAQEHGYLVAYMPKVPPTPPQDFDWSFDGFRPTSAAVKERLYLECSRYHPEIFTRDRIPKPPVAAPPVAPVAAVTPVAAPTMPPPIATALAEPAFVATSGVPLPASQERPQALERPERLERPQKPEMPQKPERLEKPSPPPTKLAPATNSQSGTPVAQSRSPPTARGSPSCSPHAVTPHTATPHASTSHIARPHGGAAYGLTPQATAVVRAPQATWLAPAPRGLAAAASRAALAAACDVHSRHGRAHGSLLEAVPLRHGGGYLAAQRYSSPLRAAMLPSATAQGSLSAASAGMRGPTPPPGPHRSLAHCSMAMRHGAPVPVRAM